MRQQHGRQQIALLALAQGNDLRIVRRSLGAAVPGVIVAVAIAIVLAIGLVVLVVVRNEIIEIETVMGGDEVDAGPWSAAALVEEIAGSRHALGEVRDRSLVAFPESAHGVSELVVPLRPSRRKLTDLISARTDVPGLGDQLDAGKHRVLAARIEKAAAFV